MKDAISSALLMAVMLACFTMGAALVSWWDTTWELAVAPTRQSIYSAVMTRRSPCLKSPWRWYWREARCRVT
jgi:hypothetical protein